MSRPSVESPGFALEPFAWPTAADFYRAWLRLGLVAVLLLPDARASHALLGWLPFWLLGVPALALLQQRIARWCATRSRVDPLPVRRSRRRRRGQAVGHRRLPALAFPVAAGSILAASHVQSSDASGGARSGVRRSP